MIPSPGKNYPYRQIAGMAAAVLASTAFSQSTDVENSLNTDDDEIFVLSPFEVKASEDDGYRASNTVSGTRTNVNLKDIPLSLQAFTKEFIDDIDALELTDIVKFAPAVTPASSEFTNGNTRYNIRGFYSGTPLQNGLSGNSFVDVSQVERVEVAKGPSTLLYGQLSPGGVVNYITKKPLPFERSEIKFRVGSYDAYRLDVDTTGALFQSEDKSTGLNYRLTAAYDQKMEYYDRAERSTTVISPSIDWHPTKDASVLVQFTHYEGRETPPVMMVPNDWPGFGRLGDKWEPLPRKFNYASNQDFRNADFDTLTIDANAKLPGEWHGRIAYQHEKRKVNQMATGVGWVTDGNTQNRRVRYEQQAGKTEQFQAEATRQFDFESFKWTVLAGAQYQTSFQHNTQDQLPSNLQLPNWDLLDPSTWTLDIPFTLADLTLSTNDAQVDSTAQGVYLVNQVSALDDRLKLLGGVRYSESENTITNYRLGGVVTGPYPADAVSPQIGGMWKINDAVSFYTSYSKSFVPINGDKETLPGQPIEPYDPMIGKGTDIGFKIDAMEGKVSSTLTYFNVVNTGIVRRILTVDPNTGATGFVSSQTGEETGKGYEADVIWSPSKNLQIYASYSYLDAYVSSNEQSPQLIGNRLENSTPHLANMWVKYKITEGSLKGFSFGGGGNYTGEKQMAIQTADLVFEPTTVLNAFVSYSRKVREIRYNFTLAVNNLSDELYYPSNQSRGDPRNISLTTKMNF